MLQNLFSIHQFRLTKWSFLVHSTTLNAPSIHPTHDSILELWRTFPNAQVVESFVHPVTCFQECLTLDVMSWSMILDFLVLIHFVA